MPQINEQPEYIQPVFGGDQLKIQESLSNLPGQQRSLYKMIFIADTYHEYLNWKAALENLVLQTTRIQTIYQFSETLGEGSFGQVVLGIPKIALPFTQEEESKINGPLGLSNNGFVNSNANNNITNKIQQKVAIKILKKS